MAWQLVWSERARCDLKEIHDYVAQHNAAAAERIIDEILAKVELVQGLPRMGRVYKRIDDRETRLVVSGKYRIFYDLSEVERRVEILAVRHHARAEPDLD